MGLWGYGVMGYGVMRIWVMGLWSYGLWGYGVMGCGVLGFWGSEAVMRAVGALCRIELEEWEHVTCMKTVSLKSEETVSGLKGYVAVGTCLMQGEEVTCRGRVSVGTPWGQHWGH